MLVKLYILLLEYMIFVLINLKLSPKLIDQDLAFVAKINCIDRYLASKKAKKVQIDIRPTCIARDKVSQKSVKDLSSREKIHFKIYDVVEDELLFVIVSCFKLTFWRNVLAVANIITENIEKDLELLKIQKIYKKRYKN